MLLSYDVSIPLGCPFESQAAPLLTQHSAHAPGKTAEDGPSAWTPGTHMVTWRRLLTLGFGLVHPASAVVIIWEREQADGKILFVSCACNPFK